MQNAQRLLARSGAALFTIGLFTGLWSAAALTGMVTVRLPRLALAAHLNGLLGGLWCIAVAFTLPWLKLTEKKLRFLVRLVILPSWANWFITLVASFVGENGLSYRGFWQNDAIAAALQILVVLPALAGSVLWTCGFGCCQKKNSG